MIKIHILDTGLWYIEYNNQCSQRVPVDTAIIWNGLIAVWDGLKETVYKICEGPLPSQTYHHVCE